jgi:hypothetical protein
VKPGGAEGLLFATDAFNFADPGFGIKFGDREKLIAGLFDGKARTLEWRDVCDLRCPSAENILPRIRSKRSGPNLKIVMTT